MFMEIEFKIRKSQMSMGGKKSRNVKNSLSKRQSGIIMFDVVQVTKEENYNKKNQFQRNNLKKNQTSKNSTVAHSEIGP
jgi:hypothetical protein